MRLLGRLVGAILLLGLPAWLAVALGTPEALAAAIWFLGWVPLLGYWAIRTRRDSTRDQHEVQRRMHELAERPAYAPDPLAALREPPGVRTRSRIKPGLASDESPISRI